MGLIQTPDQLRFSYMAVLEGAKCITGDSSVQVCAPPTPQPILLLSTFICLSCKPRDSISSQWELFLPKRFIELINGVV